MDEVHAPGVAAGLVALLQNLQAAAEQIVADLPIRDRLLADLGVSRYQLTEPERGFSFMAEGPLDMRMDRSQGATAAELVNFTSEKELADLIYRFGEERRSRRISRAIVRARPIHTTERLARVIEEAVPRTSKLHPSNKPLRDKFELYFDGTRTGPAIHVAVFGTGAKSTP